MTETITFGMYLTGHDKKTIEQMYQDFSKGKALSDTGEGWIEEVKGNSKIVCLLRVGDAVTIDKAYGSIFGGKKTKIKEIERARNCESGFMCNTEMFETFLDANWYILNSPSLNTNKI